MEPKSKTVRLGKCIADQLNEFEFDGSIQTGVGLEGYTEVEARFREHFTPPGKDLSTLHLYVVERSLQHSLEARKCKRAIINMAICIFRKYDDSDLCGEYDELRYFMDQIAEQFACSICCKDFSLESFGEFEPVGIDEEFAQRCKLVTFIPLTFEYCFQPSSDGSDL